MDTQAIVAELNQEIARLTAARDALQGLNGSTPTKKAGRRTMSPEARAKIAASAKKRWRDAKKAGKSTLG